VIIAGYEVDLRDLKGASSYAMDCIAVPAKGRRQNLLLIISYIPLTGFLHY
jgi:hypothetical protein